MNFLKPVMLATLAAIAFAAPALAQREGGEIAPGSGMVVDQNGKMFNHVMPDTLRESAIKNGKLVTATQMFINHGGKMYMVEDHKMPDGKMMSEHMRMRP